MTKADKVLIVILMVLSLVLIFPLFFLAPASNQATVLVENKEVLRIDLNKDESYSVQGKLGKVKIQVKDGKVRVSQEKVNITFARNKAMFQAVVHQLSVYQMKPW